MKIEGLEAIIDLKAIDAIGYFLEYLGEATGQGWREERYMSIAQDVLSMEDGRRVYKLPKGKLIGDAKKNRLELTYVGNGLEFGLIIYPFRTWPLFFAPILGEKHEEGTFVGYPGQRLGYALRLIDKAYFNII